MANIKIDTETFRVISIFERVTKVQPRDCILSENSAYFLIDGGKTGLAIGKKGVTAKKLARLISKDVRIFEYSENPETLVKNLIPSAENIEISGPIAKLMVPEKNKPAVIGRGGKNINVVKEFLERHCGITDLKIR